jgi:hypothetical protein
VTAPQPSSGRSIFLTVACAFAGVAALQALAFAYSAPIRDVAARAGAPWVPLFLLVTAFLALVFLVVLWTMRRWGLWGYLAVIGVQTAAFLSIGSWNPLLLVCPVLIAGAAAWNWERLR